MQTLLLILLTLLMGVMLAIYLPMNSSVARHLGSPITASLPFFLMAFTTSILVFLVFGDYKTIPRLKNLPTHLFLPGFIGAFMVLGTTFLIPKIGARKLFILVIAGQVIMAMIVSHYAWLESPKDPITLTKVLGALLLVLGAVLSNL